MTERTTTYILILLLLPGAISCSFNRSGNPSTAYTRPSPEPTPVDPRANQIKLLMLDGTSTRLQDLIGNNKVVLINFWATWCGPCRKEIPELVALQNEYKDRGLEVIGLSVDDPGDQAEVKNFARQFSINYSIGFSSEEMLQLFSGRDDPRLSIPQSYIFDRNGKLIDRLKGFRRTFRTWAEGAINYALENP
ncbi:MAG: TlpA family protein disulfide reductase [Acidobacteria bacterium]|nr:TlpA family protein disulfide reductase [Acidobacteriota bacterium]